MKIDGEAKLIAAAFVKARGEMSVTVAKDAKGNYGKYVTLAALVEASTSILAKNGLAIVQEAGMDEHGVTVDTWLIHESGATIDFGVLTMPLTNRTPQSVGSALTYGRRYALAAVCGLAPDDDDGQAAENAQARPQRTQATQQVQSSTNGTRNAPSPAALAENGDVAFRNDSPPTDAELEVLGTWRTPQEAQAWAVQVGACLNDFEAQNSFKNTVEDHGGRLTKENVAAVYLAFLRKQNAKLSKRVAA